MNVNTLWSKGKAAVVVKKNLQVLLNNGCISDDSVSATQLSAKQRCCIFQHLVISEWYHMVTNIRSKQRLK